MSNLECLQFQRFRFTLRCQTPLQLNEFVANDWRGAFGKVLHEMACLHPQDAKTPCERCRSAQHCHYGKLFDSRDNEGREIIRPYILEPLLPHQRSYGPGEALVLDLLLVGQALHSWGACVEVLQRLGERGLGRDYWRRQGRLVIEHIEVAQADGGAVVLYQADRDLSSSMSSSFSPFPSPLDGARVAAWTQGLTPQRMTLFFVAPLQLRTTKPPRCPIQEVEFHQIWDSLQQRIEQVMEHHCGVAYQSDFKVLKRQALAVRKVEDSLSWHSQMRRTSKRHLVDMGGLRGHVVFEGDFAPFLPVLAIGEWLHCGHGCDLGNGRYRLSPA